MEKLLKAAGKSAADFKNRFSPVKLYKLWRNSAKLAVQKLLKPYGESGAKFTNLITHVNSS